MIKFGTSGWRAIIADEFTYGAVRLVTQAITIWISERAPGSEVIVGYDTRFMAEDFAAQGARITPPMGLSRCCAIEPPRHLVAETVSR